MRIVLRDSTRISVRREATVFFQLPEQLHGGRWQASCPGLLIPALSFPVGENLVKLVTCNHVCGSQLDVWGSGTTTSECATDYNHGPWSVSAINAGQTWWYFWGLGTRPSAVRKECATSPHVQPMSRYVTACIKFYQLVYTESHGERRLVWRWQVCFNSQVCSQLEAASDDIPVNWSKLVTVLSHLPESQCSNGCYAVLYWLL